MDTKLACRWFLTEFIGPVCPCRLILIFVIFLQQRPWYGMKKKCAKWMMWSYLQLLRCPLSPGCGEAFPYDDPNIPANGNGRVFDHQKYISSNKRILENYWNNGTFWNCINIHKFTCDVLSLASQTAADVGETSM